MKSYSSREVIRKMCIRDSGCGIFRLKDNRAPALKRPLKIRGGTGGKPARKGPVPVLFHYPERLRGFVFLCPPATVVHLACLLYTSCANR